jgi:hypothetical protein
MSAGEKFIVAVFAVFIFICAFTLVVAVSTFLTMWAWNLIVAGLFHGPHINFLQSLAIGVLIGAIRSIVSVTVNKK